MFIVTKATVVTTSGTVALSIKIFWQVYFWLDNANNKNHQVRPINGFHVNVISTMTAEPKLTVSSADGSTTWSFPYTKDTTAEDVCIKICRDLKITPVVRHIFALKVPGKNVFLMPAQTFTTKKNNYEFRYTTNTVCSLIQIHTTQSLLGYVSKWLTSKNWEQTTWTRTIIFLIKPDMMF